MTNKLFTRDQLPSRSVTLKMSTVVTDTLSDETHVTTSYEDIASQVSM